MFIFLVTLWLKLIWPCLRLEQASNELVLASNQLFWGSNKYNHIYIYLYIYICIYIYDTICTCNMYNYVHIRIKSRYSEKCQSPAPSTTLPGQPNNKKRSGMDTFWIETITVKIQCKSNSLGSHYLTSIGHASLVAACACFDLWDSVRNSFCNGTH